MLELDEYNRYARLYPALITIIPIIVLNHFYINPELSGFLHSFGNYSIFAEIPVPVLSITVVMEVNRFISKGIIEKLYFADEQRMPTTDLLMHADHTFSSLFKDKVRKKILKDFGLRLLSRRQEKRNENEARRLIVEAVSQIREKIRKGRLLFQYNKQYGFIRNTIGGSLIAFALSLMDVYIFSIAYPNPTALVLSELFAVLYLVPVLFSRYALTTYGKYYATRLFHEYISMQTY